jgi:hypothetical protein
MKARDAFTNARRAVIHSTQDFPRIERIDGVRGF